ncbi:beta-ketoacyl-ACP synthase III [Nocardioides terrisoli]|uniref:beta-ketoacyl-ACP synthase III n=1 Tax=Nocardioides terrisoli TaxID=3388267 RepID=UPI00287BB955|nr:beta-ketoacyl-ACP synthase III [Nocardioides marmorisolisilvae]
MSAPSLDTVRTLQPSAVLGLGLYRASRVVPNADVVEAIDSSDEWIQQRSGIVERRFATPEESVVAMSVGAAREAIDDAGIQPGQIDVVIVATVSHLLQTPSAATMIAHELGSTGAAFDISAACAGFCHGLAIASDLVRAGSARHVLVIGVERLSDITSPTDRGTAFIFSDGAGAAVVGPAETQGIGPVVWGSDGGKYDLIRQTEDWRDVVAVGSTTMPHLVMKGAEVFRWAAFEMAKVATETLERSGVRPEDLDLFVPHQANMRITDAMARSMKLPDTVRIARDIAHQGNASAASVPLALRQLVLDGEARSGDTALLIAFGAGLSFAAQVIRIP